MTVDPTRWKEISRRRLTSEEARQYIAGNTPSSAERSFDLAVVTTFKQNPFRGLQITYERIPVNEQRPQSFYAVQKSPKEKLKSRLKQSKNSMI